MAILDQLPEPVRAGLKAFTTATRQVFADDLVSIVLFLAGCFYFRRMEDTFADVI